ncbi:MAG: serine/threonine protein kinase, partial [Gemmataceae bacterium]|nr:serine/threonine protein kinase [Gemmataceae bacterium]
MASKDDLPGLFGLNPPNRPRIKDLLRALGLRYVTRLGWGGEGDVYLVWSEEHKRELALKVGTGADPGSVCHEAHVLYQLNHPSVVRVYRSGTECGFYYLLRDYVAGNTAREEQSGEARKSVAEAVEVVARVADVVQYCHDNGVSGLDLNLSNVLLALPPKYSAGRPDEGDVLRGRRPVLFDYGLARLGWGKQRGWTLNYQLPESLADPLAVVGVKADVYTLGGMLYELLTGRLLYAADTVEKTLAKVRDEAPEFPADVPLPRALKAIVLRCLAKDPKARYQSAAEVVGALRGFNESQKPYRVKWPLVAAIVVFGVLCTAGGMYHRQGEMTLAQQEMAHQQAKLAHEQEETKKFAQLAAESAERSEARGEQTSPRYQTWTN